MILLKKPYKPTMYTGASASFNVYGKSFTRLEAVYLSGAPLFNTTFHNPFSAVPKLSAHYPGFTGYKLPLSAYTTNFDNTISIKVPKPYRLGFIDVIAQNPAGYGILTQLVIKERYTETQDLSTLRPWAYGIEVLSGEDISALENQMYAINDDILITIAEENIVTI
jgi:hypothetical protein